ncbi:SprT family zinc-dependent metalloprotease [Polaromonas sp.]|uniref:M48 family metallopeptidase n=1 Tax=Polaromonas sp. TaxID=1869339 RepID=UPI0024878CDA|nr:SprT family zinc-dependent metalloprotease [Polaromonas sp.]MDI1274720.1 SprT family zinc-dependent metalloprotease [Polaromonas sp.]
MQRLLQFTLDLFDLEPARPAAPPPAKLDEPQSNRPPAQADHAPTAIKRGAEDGPQPLPAQTLAQVLAPATYRHPAATREALLEGAVVAYQFRRGKRRTIGFSVGAEGLVVSAPKWVPLYDIDKAVQEKSGWIVRKLQETRARHDRLESARIEWKDGTTLPFLGEPVIVVIDPRHAFGAVGGELKSIVGPGAVLHTGADAPDSTLPGVPNLTLHIALAHDATPEQIRDSVQAWLMRQANRLFTERLNHYAPHLGVQWRKLSLSSAGTRWGSASADGAIRLNWRLIHFKQSVIDYVVVHELSHLRVMDHSPRFWDTVRTVVPDYAELRNQLKEESVPRW